MGFWTHIAEQIEQHTGQAFQLTSRSAIGSGCINEAYRISNGTECYFVKLNSAQFGDMFEVEALSLGEMTNSHSIKVPEPVCYGEFDSQAYLVLEYLELSGCVNAELQGQQLASMHQVTGERFGWYRNNTIGSTPQPNTLTDDWVRFWREQRLLPQLQLAQQNGYHLPQVEQLVESFDCLFTSYQPEPSMLHGDLWGGNAAALADGTPVIFDPAFYYGDREADIAMTRLFGGFDARFYAAYNEAMPLDDGYKVRTTFYNLYHIINHLNLFGTGYLGQATSMAERVLADIK